MATIRRRPGPLAALLAAEVVSTTGSMVVLAIPGGAVAGRLGARRTMLACDLARLPLVGLVLLHAVGALSFPVLVALRLPSRLPPLTVASLAGLGQALPLWLLAAPLPAPAAVAVLGLADLANGIRVPPLRAVTLLRIPPGLRVQAMTAESTLSTTAGLLALALAGPALETLGTTPVLAGVAAVATTAAVSFAAVAMRPDPAAQDG